jgi:hypothetical protein
MSIEGRINVDVLFHDKDGTSSLKVLSLQDSDAYAVGEAAMWSGTCGTAAVTLSFGPTTYRDAAGSLVSVVPGGSGRVAFLASGNGGVLTQQNGSVVLFSQGHACLSNIDEQESVSVAAFAGTTRYTVIVYSES